MSVVCDDVAEAAENRAHIMLEWSHANTVLEAVILNCKPSEGN